MANRTETLTQRVETSFGSLYVHVSFVDGRIVDIGISTPGKHLDTTIGNTLISIGTAITEMIDAVQAKP